MDSRQCRSWTLFMRLANAMRDYASSIDESRVEKMTIAQEKVLCTVFQYSPNGIKLKEIAKIVKLSPGAVSQIIEYLVQEGMVERSHDPNDRRAVNIRITPRSRAIRDQVVSHFDQIVGSVLEERTPEERDAFIAIVERILDGFTPKRESVRKHVGETLLSLEEYS